MGFHPVCTGVRPTACDAEISVAENRLKEITSDSEAIEVMQGLAKTVGELQARKRLSENITLVTDHLEALKLSISASHAAGKITTNAISLKRRATEHLRHGKTLREQSKTNLSNLD